jgi:hypothetical protein
MNLRNAPNRCMISFLVPHSRLFIVYTGISAGICFPLLQLCIFRASLLELEYFSILAKTAFGGCM